MTAPIPFRRVDEGDTVQEKYRFVRFGVKPAGSRQPSAQADREERAGARTAQDRQPSDSSALSTSRGSSSQCPW